MDQFLIDEGQDKKDTRTAHWLFDKKFVIALEIALIIFLSLAKVAPLFSAFLVVSGLLWLRKLNWRDMGLMRVVNWQSVIAFGVALGVAFILLESLALRPLISMLIHQEQNLQAFSSLHSNPFALFGSLVAAWTTAAFGEEMLFRGYFLRRMADLFGPNPAGWTLALIAQAILFGFLHSYQGLTGALISGVFGLLSGMCALKIRHIWFGVIAHGLIDTAGYLLIFAS